MNVLIPIIIIAVVLIYLGFKWNNLRTKFAFFFILFGVLFVLFFTFLIVTGSSFNFSGVGELASSLKIYALWIKSAALNVFEATGKVIGSVGNSTG